jgi:signal transduction histidine kinase
MADTQALHSIFTNLLENAVKYSESAPEIEVEITDLGDFTKVEVRDQGIGISELDKPLIFDKFYRSGNEETRRTKGTGLGLFIVNYLAELHQASIRALENTPKGTNFDIRFKNIHS